jgi:sugar/nucleoside kinase (ribokinase family)
MFDLITIGDSVIDIFVPLTEAEIVAKKDQTLLGLRYGDKIPVGDSVFVVGGNAANSAVSGSRLKLKSAIYVNIGGDHDGLRTKDYLKTESVDTRYIVKNENLPSNHNIILDFKGERTILTHHQDWKYDLPELDRSKWIYFTSLSPSFSKSNVLDQLTGYLERTNAKLLYNPGTFQIKSGIKKNPRILSKTEVLIVNLEESKLILGYEEKEVVNLKRLMEKLVDLGPKMIIITDGKRGSDSFDGEKHFHLPVFPANLVEMTGAGDAYATGVLAGLFHGEDLAGAMRWGAANSASVVEYIGSQKGLLTYHGMQERLKENFKILPREIK